MNYKKMNKDDLYPKLIIIILLLEKSTHGRYKLAKYLDISLAKTRGLLNLLIEKSLAKTSGQSSGRKGTRLTRDGKLVAKNLSKFMFLDIDQNLLKIPVDIISNDLLKILVLLNIKDLETTGVYERDIAVRAGAIGSITLIKNQNNAWIFPDDRSTSITELSKRDETLLNKYNTAIIVFGDHLGSIYKGATEIAHYHLGDSFITTLSPFLGW